MTTTWHRVDQLNICTALIRGSALWKAGQKESKACFLFLKNVSFSWQAHQRSHLLSNWRKWSHRYIPAVWYREECAFSQVAPPPTGLMCTLCLLSLSGCASGCKQIWSCEQFITHEIIDSMELQWEHGASTQMNYWAYASACTTDLVQMVCRNGC